MSRYQIRQAESTPQREAVYSFRYQCYVEELDKKDTPGAVHDRQVIRQLHDDHSRHYYVEDGPGRICAVFTETALDRGPVPASWRPIFGLDSLAGIDPRTISVGSRLMLRSDIRGSTLLARLLGHVYRTQLEEGRLYALMYCSPALVALYEQLGFRRYTNSVNLSRGGTYMIPMMLLLTDVEHLRRVGSPFHRLAEGLDLAPPATGALVELFPKMGQKIAARTMAEDELWTRISAGPVAGSPPSVFSGLTEEEVRTVIRKAALLDVAAGDRITRQGRMDTEMFVALEGLFEAQLFIGDKTISLGLVGRGEIVGESGFFGLPRRADVVALTDGRVLVLSDTLLEKLHQSRTPVYVKFMRNLWQVLSHRLTAANERLLESFGDGR
ncbi:MAG: cyclic nucleotide-binding domain-containing protein [Proteobacteria bacterium]|nr:cyclic nucleotide-binding domain-containing protein [Pseudomonadota bacterium]MBU1740847.1 cyclic nucleotide-binding domain-containing protein [Pseudomonadota bacterium]